LLRVILNINQSINQSINIENGLLLNLTKTEALVTGSRHQLSKFDRSAGIYADGSVVQFNKSICVLGVMVDELLSFDDLVSAVVVVQSCNNHIRSLRHIRRLIDRDTANTLACAIVNSRLDYCNALLYAACLSRAYIDYSAFRTRSHVSFAMFIMVNLPLAYFKLFIGYQSQTELPTRLLQ